MSKADKRAMLGIVFVFLCAAAVILCVQLYLRRYIQKFEADTIIQGVYIGNTEVAGLTLKEAEERVKSDLSAYAEEKVLLTLEDGRTGQVTLGSLGLTVDNLDSAAKEAVDYGKKGNAASCYKILKKAEKKQNHKKFEASYKITEESAEKALKDAMGGLLNVPENAKVSQGDSGIEITEGKPGETIDIKKTVAAINQMLGGDWEGKGGSVRASVTYVDPDIQADDLKDMTDLLGSYTTVYGRDPGSAQNIESGAGHIGGLLLKPGEEISVNAVMEPYTAENGYTEADSFEGDQVVQTMGGGICQVSTTLYNAVLLAELEVTERYPHTMMVSYVEPSMDAAIADDVLDLGLKNNLDTSIYIESITADSCLTFNIYGKETRPASRTVQYISETTETKDPEGKRFVATQDAAGIYYTQSPAEPEVSARLWKAVYENGAEVSRDIVNYSQYLPSKETVAVGTASERKEITDKLNAAIQTQDEATIMKCIQDIQISGTQQ